jgi:hypothetical protein
MPTTTVKTIGSGGDYTTLASWEAGAPANLVTADQIWQGQLISAATNISGTGTLLTVAGSTTDSTRYKELTTASGASFRDNANVQTNALQWNSANGASIESTTYYLYAIVVSEANFRISKLQVRDVNGTQSGAIQATGTGTGMVVDYCIFEGTITAASNGVVSIKSGKMRNSIAIQRKASCAAIVFSELDNEFYNCTFVVPSNFAKATAGVSAAYSNLTMKNCAVFGATADVSLSASSLTATTCYTDDASPSTGFTTLTYNTSAFVNITDATRDYRLPSGSGLIDVGTTDTTNAANDIAGTARPSGSGYDVGCWEYVSAAADTLWAQACL